MSLTTMTTMAAMRDTQAPKKKDLGKTSPSAGDGDESSGALELLVTIIPTELVTLYTGALAVATGLIKKPTLKNPNPDLHEVWRWGFFAALVALTAMWLLAGKRQKTSGPQHRFPALELYVTVVAAIGWGLGSPGSPLQAAIHNTDDRAIATAAAAALAVGLIWPFAPQLNKKRKAKS